MESVNQKNNNKSNPADEIPAFLPPSQQSSTKDSAASEGTKKFDEPRSSPREGAAAHEGRWADVEVEDDYEGVVVAGGGRGVVSEPAAVSTYAQQRGQYRPLYSEQPLYYERGYSDRQGGRGGYRQQTSSSSGRGGGGGGEKEIVESVVCLGLE